MRDFNHSVSVLVKAYMQDTLQWGNCAACAVGNLIADACGFTFTSTKEWSLVWKGDDELNLAVAWLQKLNFEFGGRQMPQPNEEARANELLNSTGYSHLELNEIERRFEEACCFDASSRDGRMFNGLMAVVDVLADIHGIDLKEKEEAKLMFVKV